jgi:parvulin-like peptidyl-prolyl isomerase
MKKHTFFLILIAGTLLLSGFAAAELIDRIVAKVGSEAIFLSDLDKAVQANKLNPNVPTQEELLQQLIDRALLLQEAKRLKLVPSELAVKAETKRQLAQIRTAFKSEIEFQQTLEKEGLTNALLEEQFTRRAKEELMVRILLRKKIEPITEEKVNRFLTENPEKAKQLDQVRFRQIFFPVLATATDSERVLVLEKANIALSKLKSGKQWEEVGREYSEDLASWLDNGDLGFISHEDCIPEIEKVAFSLPIGKISELIKTELGYHLIQVTDRLSVKQYLENEALKTTKSNLITQLRETTKIEIRQ